MKFSTIQLLLCALLATSASTHFASAKDLSSPLELSLLRSRAHAHISLRAHSRGLHRIPRASLSAHKRATQLQEEQAAALARWDESFHEMNAKWQAAANAALAKGETPMTFDEFAKQNGFKETPDIPQSAGEAPKQTAQQTAASPAPAAAASTSSNNNNNDISSLNDDEESCDATDDSADESDEEDCTDDSSSSSSSTSAAASSTPKSTSSPSPSAPSTGAGTGSSTFSGKATFYDPSVGAGSCGQTMQSSDYIIALNAAQMQASYNGGNPNENPLCGKKLVLRHNGKTVQATITDTCPGCQGANSVDMSPGLFNALATDYERTTAQSFTVDWSFA